jgi:primosomal protein N' (replication factor Y)
MKYADLIIEAKTSADRQVFTYQVDDLATPEISISDIVVAPFGSRKIRGLVLRIHTDKPNYSTKKIVSLAGYNFPRSTIKIIYWLSKYYLVTLGEALKLFLPPNLSRPRKLENVVDKSIKNRIRLTLEQEEVYKKIVSDWQSGRKKGLLFGVTGSGKTEVFIKLIDQVVSYGGQVIYLLPEIYLASVILDRLKNHYQDRIAIVHSKIQKSEQLDIYKRFSSGELPIIIGARSALLSLPKNLQLIIVDEEHDQSYKQDQSPRYDARILAEIICRESGSAILYGSATPRVETYHRTANNELSLYRLDNRFEQRLPDSSIVDMKKEFQSKNYSLISEKLREEVEIVLKNKKQVIVFLNRRGMATFVSCRSCGSVEECPNCLIPLIHHLVEGRNHLFCHQCDYKKSLPTICENCQSQTIKSFGAGIQKVESEIIKLFPDADTLRVDSDIKPMELKKIIKRINNHQFDILIGTQIIAKGLDLPAVDLVGIISADTALHLPDYHSGEQTFQLITQVSGRSGRREKIGKTVIQSYWPDNQSVLFASEHNFDAFYENELKVRKTFNYPPYRKIIRVISQDFDRSKSRSKIRLLAKELKASGIDFIGPAPAFHQRIRNRWRYHLIIKFRETERAKIYILLRQHINKLIFDLDPVNML